VSGASRRVIRKKCLAIWPFSRRLRGHCAVNEKVTAGRHRGRGHRGVAAGGQLQAEDLSRLGKLLSFFLILAHVERVGLCKHAEFARHES
jgi:hypothetical protein